MRELHNNKSRCGNDMMEWMRKIQEWKWERVDGKKLKRKEHENEIESAHRKRE